jgi:hypothetical protein
MANSLVLFTGKENTGRSLHVVRDAPNLPSDFDARSESLIVDHASVPVSLYSNQNYTGQRLVLVRGGGSDDLSTLAGNWFHKIRSIKFSHVLTHGTDEQEQAELSSSKLMLRPGESVEADRLLATIRNPLFATSGCYFPGNVRTATFNYSLWFLPTVGQRVEIVVLNGDCVSYSCTGGQCITQGDLSMILQRIDQPAGNPYAKVVLTGTGV